jgi:hypothetical protein
MLLQKPISIKFLYHVIDATNCVKCYHKMWLHVSTNCILILRPLVHVNPKLYFTLRVPCIVIYSYNKNQQDALFLNFILVKNSTGFGQIHCPSSGGLLLYSQQLVFVILLMLTANDVGMQQLEDNQHNQYDKYQLL